MTGNRLGPSLSKGNLRKRILKRLNEQSAHERVRKSLEIKKRLFALKEFKFAKTVMFYVSKDGEVDTIQMIKDTLRMGKRVAVPVTKVEKKELIASQILDLEKELTRGPYGILEPKSGYVRPVPVEEIDLVIVPGIAFDKMGRRLGRGAGYYDRFLKKFHKDIPFIGLAFDFQVLENLPILSHDIPVSKLLVA